MSDTTQIDPRPTMEQLERIAAEIFARHGVDFESAERAGGWTNITWLASELALRLSTRPHNGDAASIGSIRREVRLAALLPPEVGYPANIETGVTEGLEWSLSKRVPGQCLGEVWDGLSWAERASAVAQLWQHAQAIHNVQGPEAASMARTRAWFNSCDVDEALAATDRLVQQKLFSEEQGQRLRAGLRRFGEVLPAAHCVLNHGDLTLDNAIWYKGQVVSVLDFEFALMAPVELDLNTLLKSALPPEPIPAANDDPDSPDCQQGWWQLRQAALDLARPVIDHPGGRELLFGYAILLEQWLFELWLAHPEGEGPMETWQPYRRLLALADGHGGYLAPLLVA